MSSFIGSYSPVLRRTNGMFLCSQHVFGICNVVPISFNFEVSVLGHVSVFSICFGVRHIVPFSSNFEDPVLGQMELDAAEPWANRNHGAPDHKQIAGCCGTPVSVWPAVSLSCCFFYWQRLRVRS
jgi:hypothetical protein